MSNAECLKITEQSCRNCNIPTILWAKAKTQADVDRVAERIIEENCPDESGGMDQAIIDTVYNNKPSGTKKAD